MKEASEQTGRDVAEQRRLHTLRSFCVLDTPAESDYDDLTALAAELCGTPVALITLVDSDRQWFKSRRGLDARETPREESFCAHALGSHDVLVIPDARLDPRVADYRCVREDPYFRFYAGAPLVTDGEVLGTLCVADTEPRNLSTVQLNQLRVLAAQVVAQLVVRRQAVELTNTVQQMRAAQRMLDGVLKHTDVLIYAKDVSGKFIMVNPAVQKATRTTENMIGRTDHDFFDPDIAEEYRRNDSRIMATGQRQVFTERIVQEDGSHRTYRSTKFPVYDDAGVMIGTAGLSTDVTELEAVRAAHEDAEDRLRTLVEHSPVAIAVVDQAGRLAFANPAAAALCGVPSVARLQDRSALDLVTPEQRDNLAELLDSVFRGEPAMTVGRARLLKDDGNEVPVEFTISRIHYSGELALQTEVRDITADLSDREHLQAIANTDPLTSMMNRRAWTSRVLSIIATPRPVTSNSRLVVAMIDIDRFKAYNDRYGHPAGDVLLQQIAKTLQSNARRSDVIARWGGEEFVVALPDTDPLDAVEILERLRSAMPSGQTCSIGYTIWADNDNLDSCISRADQALYAAKDGGRNRIAGYEN